MSHVRGFLTDMQKYGLPFALKYALDFFGKKTFTTVHYPLNGNTVRVRSHRFWKTLEQGLYEPNPMAYISRTIKEGDVILDVGAWMGPYTLLFSNLVKNTGKVYAFDPDPIASSFLIDNVHANHCTNVQIEGLCLSNVIGNVQLKTQGKNRKFGDSNSSIISLASKETTREITVLSTTIDKYCEDNDIRPNGLKIDVEGAEYLVIEGARKTLSRFSPWVLLEFHGLRMAENRPKYWQNIIDGAREVIFLEGESTIYHYGDEIVSIPDCLRFQAFIQY